MGDNRINDEGVGGVSPSDIEEAHKEDGPARPVARLVMSPRRIGYRFRVASANAGICMQAAGNTCGIYCDTPDLQILFWGGADTGVQS